MPQILPFRGIRYTPRAGEFSDRLAPPYDVISPAQQAALAARNEHNAVRLELAEGGDEPELVVTMDELAVQAQQVQSRDAKLGASKPGNADLVARQATTADATDLPVLVYDIPGRTGIPIQTETLIRLAEHPRIVAVKDAKGDLWAASQVMAATDLQWYSGDDVLNLAHLAQGAVGVVSVVGHVAGDEYAAMVRAVADGALATAREIHRRLIPVVQAIMSPSQGAIMAKAALAELGVIPSAFVRLPLVESPPEHLAMLREGLSQSGIL